MLSIIIFDICMWKQRDDREMKKAIFRPKMLFFELRRLADDISPPAQDLFFELRRLAADTYPLFSLDFASKLRIIYVFFVKICLIKNFLLSLHPKWVHQRSARIHMYSFQESIYAETICPVGNKRLWVRGFFTYWKAFIDALLLTNKKLRTLFTIPVRNKVTNRCLRVWHSYIPCRSLAGVSSYRRRFLYSLFDWMG